MISSDINIISPLLCKTLTIQTSEKIQKLNIYNFLTTSIQTNNITLDIDDRIFYYYIEESSIYEIYIINTTKQHIITQADIFKVSYKEDVQSIDLFITSEYFVVYKNTNLYFFKENKNYAIDDILSFIKYKYKIKINNINIVNENQIKTYENDFLNNNGTYLKFSKEDKSNSFYYFILYIVFISFSFIYYNSTLQTNQIKINKIEYETNKDIIYDIVKLCNKNKIQIQKLMYQNKYYMQISSKSKKNIDKFLTYYKNQITIKNIYINKKIYILEFEIES